ncbi:MAG: LytR C-terminal domain-containing protein [Elusimicrobia bacterium]|nr:LytR C-terminal domain-containing protein [Elusimicrobiota bacterium]
MEQSSGKKERLMLAAGLAAALALAAAQWFSPAAKALNEGRDVRVALLADSSAALLVYHPVSSTVNAFIFPQGRNKRKVSGYQRACDLAALAGAPGSDGQGEVFYIALSSAPDMEALWAVLNGWRSAPLKFFEAASWVSRLRSSGATNIPPFGLFVLFSEFSGLNSSNFILTEAARGAPGSEEGEPAQDAARPAFRVEVFNASGRKDLAGDAAKYLRTAGFDVLTASSYGKIEKHTRIMCFSGDTAAALKLRSAMGLEDREIVETVSRKSVAEAAVIMGTDFNPAALGRTGTGKREQ